MLAFASGVIVYYIKLNLRVLQVVILLVVSPEERSRRMMGRGEELSEEETELEKSQHFQQRLVYVTCMCI